MFLLKKMNPVIPKKELHHIMKQFLNDHERGISVQLFAELCGLSDKTLQTIFMYDTAPLTEFVQRRVSKGYQSWLNGEVAVMQNMDKTRFVDYRRVPKPRFGRKYGLKVENGQIKMDLGVKNKADYSFITLDKQLERG